MAAPDPISLAEKLALFHDHWHPRVIADYNGNEVRVAKLEGTFSWHSHADTDELFLVLAGEITIEFRDRTVRLRQGELLVVPRGVEHRPSAAAEAHILLMDRAGEPNTGNQPSEYTRDSLERR
ncbi:MAG: cupin domain-containing protein [Kofleriaceae bacterium]